MLRRMFLILLLKTNPCNFSRRVFMPNESMHFETVKSNAQIIQVGGDVIGNIAGGNQTIINNIIQNAAKQIVTAPYKFLASYDICDRDIFFGRDAVIEELIGKMPRYKTLVINGRSGAGKTSLINAGLIPRLTENGYQFLSFRDYSDPLRQLREHVKNDKVFEPYANHTASLSQFLKTVTRQPKQHVVVIFDQFERFFVNVLPVVRAQFIQEIKACLDSDLSGEQLDIVFALREDFFGALVSEFETHIPTFFNQTDRLNLLPLSREEAREAIINPLRKLSTYKIGYDKNFVDDVLLPGLMGESAGGKQIDPPHLQIVCNQLYQAVLEEHGAVANLEAGDVILIDRQLYTRLGETKGILHTYLDDVIHRTTQGSPDGDQNIVRSMLKLMVATTGTRKFVTLSDLQRQLPDVPAAEVNHLLRQLQESRIIETRSQSGTASYSVSHEFMVAKVQSWFDERELQRKKAEEILERGLAEWKSTQALLNEKQVEHIRKWLPVSILGADAIQLVTESQHVYEENKRKNAEQERRIKRNRKAFQWALGSGLAISLILASVAFWQRSTALTEKHQAQVNAIETLTQSAQALFLVHDEIGGLLASVKAGQLAKHIILPDKLHYQVIQTLQDVVDQMREQNRLARLNWELASFAFSPDSRMIAAGGTDGIIKLWGSDGRDIINKFRGQHTGSVLAVAFSPDGQVLASAGADKTLKIWRVADGQELRTLQGHTEAVQSVAFSPDGRMLVSGSRDQTVRLWRVSDGREIRTFIGHTSPVSSVAFRPDGKLMASASNDGEIKLWNVSNGEEVWTLGDGLFNAVFEIAFSPDGKLLASGHLDSRLILWSVANGQIKRTFQEHAQSVRSLAFSPDGEQIASGDQDGVIKIRNVSDGSHVQTIQERSQPVQKIAFSRDGRLLAATSYDQTIKLWRIAEQSQARILSGTLLGPNGSIAFSPDSQFIAASGRNDTINLWNVRDGQQLRSWNKGTAISIYDNYAVAFSPDGKWLASGNEDKTITIWSVAEHKPVRTLPGHAGEVISVAFSPDGQWFASGSKDQTIKLWNLLDSREPRTLRGHARAVTQVAFGSGGKLLISLSEDQRMKFWNAANGEEQPIPQEFASGVKSFAVSSDGSMLVVGMDNIVKLWSIPEAKMLRTIPGHQGVVTSVAFSPDGKLLASVDYQNAIKLWRIQDGRELWTFQEQGETVQHVLFSQDNKWLASSSMDRNITLWDLTLDTVVERGCAWLQDYLRNNPNVPESDRNWCAGGTTAAGFTPTL